jgi:hypothetical protein
MKLLTDVIWRAGGYLKVLYRALTKSRTVALSRLFSDDYFFFSSGLFFLVPKMEVVVVSASRGVGGTSHRMTISQVQKLMASIMEACNAHEVRSVQIGSCRWTIDCPPNERDLEWVKFTVRDGFQYSRQIAKREDVINAVEEIIERINASLIEHE